MRRINELFGKRVTTSAIYVRKEVSVPIRKSFGSTIHECRKGWVIEEKSLSGICIGTRTLKDGIKDYTEEEGITFTTTACFEAAMIVTGPRSRPVFVPVWHISECNE